MSRDRIGGDHLIGLAVATLRNEISPELPQELRYAAAMIANALEIARREQQGETEAVAFELLDSFYEDGDGTLGRLADDIRSGAVSEAKTPDLRARLRKLLVAELKVRNPRFLVSRGVKG